MSNIPWFSFSIETSLQPAEIGRAAIAADEDLRPQNRPAGADYRPPRGRPDGSADGRSGGHIRLSLHPLDVFGRLRDAPPHHVAVEIAVAEPGVCVSEGFQAGCVSMFAKKNVGEAVDVGVEGHCHPASVNGQILTEV
jgi:hypothetical protein